MKDISNMIASIVALLARPKSEKIGLIRQLRKTLRKSEKTFWKASRKWRKPTIEQQKKLNELWNNMMDLSDEIENINN